MNAAIVDLREYRSRHTEPNREARLRRSREIIKEAIIRTLVEDYTGLPLVTIAAAIADVVKVLDDGGSLADAVESSAIILRQARTQSSPVNNPTIIQPFLWELKYLKNARFRVAAALICDHWRRYGLPRDDYEGAIRRARRIIDGGGTIATALYQAIGKDPGGGT